MQGSESKEHTAANAPECAEQWVSRSGALRFEQQALHAP